MPNRDHRREGSDKGVRMRALPLLWLLSRGERKGENKIEPLLAENKKKKNKVQARTYFDAAVSY